jgi:glycopeptide antibiotics resistance protein
MLTRARLVLAGSLGIYSGLILLLTLGTFRQRLPGSQAPGGVLSLDTWLDRATWTTGWSGEFLANVMLFTPWGVLAVLLLGSRRWWLALASGAAFSMLIEIAQISSTRISDPRDLVANTVGAVLGVAIGMLIHVRWSALRRAVPADERVVIGA